jgi:pimeloyl-ACP methyl ester carboxylesterase
LPPPTSSEPAATAVTSAPSASAQSPAPEAVPIQVEAVTLESGRQAFVLRGARGKGRSAFLHGVCGHGMGYLQSFQFAAAEHGAAVAPHGDLPCGDVYRSWSQDLAALELQIQQALAASKAEAGPTTLIGYSLGATRAMALARAHPERYDALVLIAAPTVPTADRLRHLRGAVMMAGSRDRQKHMKGAARAFAKAGVPSEYFALPGAAHGEMGPEAERVMGQVLEWLARQPAKQ